MTAETHVTIRRVLQAPIERVFAAWTDPAMMSRWFYPVETWTAEVENNLVVGGTYRVTMRDRQGEPTVISGTYEAIDPPARLVFTWSSHAIAGYAGHAGTARPRRLDGADTDPRAPYRNCPT